MGGKVYARGAMGDLRCLDARTGDVAWKRDLMKDYAVPAVPVWGCSSHPLVEDGLVHVLAGGKGSAAVALHADTGKEAWKALDTEEIGYSPPTMIAVLGNPKEIACPACHGTKQE
ncbi:MAG: PQQ-binding-like beta-propeller repeat protein [Gemmataceae bacterium]|nr:PQQ-binding-like beta-propeller repeat protein [Gemmataceae bacterium]